MWLAAALWTGPVAATVTLTARIEPVEMFVFDRCYYQLDVEGSGAPDPVLPEFTGFKVLSGPSVSSQIQVINGQMTQKKVYTYTLQAAKPGEWTFPPATVSSRGSIYRSDPVTVRVRDLSVAEPEQGEESSDPDAPDIPKDRLDTIFLWARVDNPSPYNGERVIVSHDLYTRQSIGDYSPQEMPSYSGFWVDGKEMKERPRLMARMVKGIKYSVATIMETVLYPTVSGDLIIDPLTMVFQVESRRTDPFDDFFNSPFGGRSRLFRSVENVVKASQPIKIHVKPLPAAGQPAGFTGAVGTFEFSTTVEKSTVQLGEAVEVNALLAGPHSLKMIPAPQFKTMEGFKAYEPKQGDITPDPNRAGWNRREFEYIFVPHQVGEFVLPALEFSYFDPGSEQYRTITTEPHPVHVEPGPGGMPVAVSLDDGGTIQLLNKDIRFIKTGVEIHQFRPPHRHPGMILLTVFPLLVTPFVLLYGFHRRRLAGDAAYARNLKAKGVSQKRFRQAIAALEAGRMDEALDELATAFTKYFGDRLNLPPGGVTLTRVSEHLKTRDIDPSVCRRVMDCWSDLDAARFAPGSPSASRLGEFIALAQSVVEELERLKLRRIKSPGRSGK